MCHLCVIWQHYPCNMYIHLQMIGLTGATELGTVTCHFEPNQCRFQWSISWWILLRRNNIFGKKFKVEHKFICAEFQIFSSLSKHDITILAIISHGNRSLTSYIKNVRPCITNYSHSYLFSYLPQRFNWTAQRRRLGMDVWLHPCSKVIGIYFLVSNDGIYFQCIDLKFSMLHDEVCCIHCGKYHECML